MSSQILHELIDDLENAVGPVKSLVSSAEGKISAAITALRQHAEADGEQLLTDTETAAKTLGGQAVADAAPVVQDLKDSAVDLAHTAEAGIQDIAGSGESTPEPAA
jgi:ketosteroid isomerase-like protein